MILKVENKYYSSLRWAVLVAIVAGFILFKPFLSVIIISMIAAFLATPIYNRISKKFKKNGLAAVLTLIVTFLLVVIPLIIVVTATVYQASSIASDIERVATGQEHHKTIQNILDSVNYQTSRITGRDIHITTTDISNYLEKYASTIASFVLDTLTSWIGSVGSIIANSILFIYIFIGLLINKDKLIELFEKLNPLGHEVAGMYLEKAGAMTKGMVGGQFTIATVQGVASALILYIVGIHYFAFFALVLTFLSIIPLGAGIVTIPIGIAMILMGNVWQGAVIILGHLLIITNIDNVLKPVLVPKSVRLHPALILLGVFGGISLFGMLGIVIGPVLLVLITSTINVYSETIPSKHQIPTSKQLKTKTSKTS